MPPEWTEGYGEGELDGAVVEEEDCPEELGGADGVVGDFEGIGDIAEPGEEGAGDDGDEDDVDPLVAGCETGYTGS